MKKLAERTNTLTKDTVKTLDDFKKKIDLAVREVENIKEMFLVIEKDVKDIRESFEKTKKMSDNVGLSVNSLSSALEEQSRAITELSKRVTYIAEFINEAYMVFSAILRTTDEIAKIKEF